MTGKLSGFSVNWDGTQNVTITINEDFSTEYDELKDSDINVEIKKYYKKRSLDASAYCWVLIDKIAEKTKIKKSEVYRNAIRDVGGLSEIYCAHNEEAADALCKGWETHGLGWQCEKTKSKIPGCINVILYFGSSVYTTKQMADLIDSLIQDAESLGIPTITPKERERMLGSWQKKQEKKATA